MAKRRGRPPGSGRATEAAASIGGALGSVMAKVDAWMAQREEIARELRLVADRMMSGENPLRARPGGDVASAASPSASPATASHARRTASGRGRAAKKRRTMSPEAREKIAAAQRARWAKQKGEPGAAARGAKKAKAAK